MKRIYALLFILLSQAPALGADRYVWSPAEIEGQGLSSVKSRTTTTPPPSPDDRDQYLVPIGATGAWAGQTDKVAGWDGSAWLFGSPIAGKYLFVDDETLTIICDGTGFVDGPSKNNFSATVDPTASDDSSTGYGVGSVWINVTAANIFLLEDATPAAANWLDVMDVASHGLGSAAHSSDTLANVNAKISDATLIDTGDSRLSDARTPTSHGLGGAAHSADTLSNVNSKVSDATLIDTGDARLSDARTPTAHAVAGAEHSASTLASLNSKVSDATLIDTGDSRLSDKRTASAVGTTGADVNVDTAAPPVTGQILKATSATTATWQAESAGGSPITVEDEGTPLTTDATKLNFAGAGVTVTEPVTDQMLVTIPGGSVGIDAQVSSSNVDTTVTNSVYEDMNSMSITTNNTASTKYAVAFNATVKASTANKTVTVVIVEDGVVKTDTERQIKFPSGGVELNLGTIHVTSSLGNAKVIKIQWKVDSGTITAEARCLYIYGVN